MDAPLTPVVNVATHLTCAAEERPHAPAIYFPDGRDRRGRVRYTHYTYRQLDRASDDIARGLLEEGIEPGTRVALMVRPSLELFSLVFGLFKATVVPVMVDPGIGLRQMKACLARARPEVFIGVPTAQAARRVLGWARGSIRRVITVGPRTVLSGVSLDAVEQQGAASDRPLPEAAPDDVAALLFTSGSTGPPKGAVYTHGNFAAQVEAIRAMYGIEPGEVDLPTFPLFALFDPALGMTTVIPDMDPTRPADADPKKILEAIEDFGVSNMFGSPALLNTLSRYAVREGVVFESLRRVISAGAPVPVAVLERMRRALPDDAVIVTPYGATECLPVASIESREVLGETARQTARGAGVCVGRPVDGADVRVIAITDAPIADDSAARELPAGEIGEIVVRARQATRAYFEEPDHTARAKIAGADGDGFAHRMGDVGYFDDKGRLWFCGRKSQRVTLDDETTLFTTQCEGVFDAHPDVYRSALVGVRRAGRQKPVVLVELEAAARKPDRVVLAELREIARDNPFTTAIQTFLKHPGFPVDIRHNAKIRREALREWAEERV